jgi:hypothetical protein
MTPKNEACSGIREHIDRGPLADVLTNPGTGFILWRHGVAVLFLRKYLGGGISTHRSLPEAITTFRDLPAAPNDALLLVMDML